MSTSLATTRPDGRAPHELRPVSIEPTYLRHAEGSALIRFGNTWVLCTASVEEKVPPFVAGSGGGWVTAEYAMLPRATHTRSGRSPGGRGQEIQRLIGRSLRAAVSLERLGARTITVDCDVLQADGGTRTAAITGGYVALAQAIAGLLRDGKLTSSPLLEPVAAVSLGLVHGELRLDLCYEEDSQAEVDMSVVMDGSAGIIELQGTAERSPLAIDRVGPLLELARAAIRQLCRLQAEALAAP
jgi:ribonuclease PH